MTEQNTGPAASGPPAPPWRTAPSAPSAPPAPSGAPPAGDAPAPTATPAGPLSYPCQGCGARVEYAPGTTVLRCPYCGYEQQIAGVDRTVEEHSYADWAATPTKPRAQLGAHLVQCRTCGAQVTSDDLSTSCPFCGSPVVVEVSADPQIAPEAVVPFAVDDRGARDAVAGWVRSRWFAPNRLKKAGTSEVMKGTYLPFWTYDASTESDYDGARGEWYYETESYTDDQGRTQTRQVRRTAWYPASGHVARDFDDVVVPASGHLPAERLEAMGPWAPAAGVPYQPDYLAGFRALRYDVEPDQGLESAKHVMAGVIEDDCRHDIGGDEQRVSSVSTGYADIMFKLVLMPVWIAAYLYGGKTFQVLVNAHTGQVVGERPYSKIKIALAAIAALIVLAVVLVIYSRSRHR
jgi:DNA-directed RNA polymerase subunit RPC12/RpoP